MFEEEETGRSCVREISSEGREGRGKGKEAKGWTNGGPVSRIVDQLISRTSHKDDGTKGWSLFVATNSIRAGSSNLYSSSASPVTLPSIFEHVPFHISLPQNFLIPFPISNLIQ